MTLGGAIHLLGPCANNVREDVGKDKGEASGPRRVRNVPKEMAEWVMPGSWLSAGSRSNCHSSELDPLEGASSKLHGDHAIGVRTGQVELDPTGRELGARALI